MEILLKNIQNMKEVTYEFPTTGLVQLQGANSNGKSILLKVMSAVATLSILDNDIRRTLIMDGMEQGTITIRYNGKILFVKLHEDRNQCFVILCRSDTEKIVRTFRDGGIKELVEEFGFRTYDKNAVCLHVFETFGIMPFVNTAYRVNYEMIDSITTDTVAQTFLNNFKTITREKAKKMLNTLDLQITNLKNEKARMIMYDVSTYSSLYSRMKEVYNILEYIEPIELSFIHIPPKVQIVDLEAPNLQEIKMVETMPVITGITDLTEMITRIKSIREGKCPICGKLLLDDREEVCGDCQ